MRIFVVVSLLIILVSGSVYCQESKSVFVGFQPAITVEPFYEEGELDIDLFPFLLEVPIGTRTNIRFLPLANYHVGGVKNGFSDIGLYTVLPIFLGEIDEASSKTSGLYIGPVLGFGRNLLNEHYTTTIAAEPGYMFKAEKSFTLVLGCQFGASYFSYDSQPNKWVFHWGPKITLGFWLNGN